MASDFQNGGHVKFILSGAPDGDISNSKLKHTPTQAMKIELVQDTICELVKYAQTGKSTIQLLLGKSPQLRFGSKSTPLHFSPTSFRSELYERDSSEASNWNFKALVTHSIVMSKAREAAAGVDAATAQLQATMESLRKEKEENRATFIDEVKDPKKMGGGTKRPAPAPFLRKLQHNNVARSLPPSPALHASYATTNAASSLTPHLASTNATSAESIAKRHALIHLLAIRPLKLEQVVSRTRMPSRECLVQLQKIATQSPSSSAWELDNRWYKELDPWVFRYSSGDERQAVIDNAVRAFDRLRLSRDDRHWQLLLAQRNRGKGIVLSKLNLGTGAAVGRSTPLPNPDSASGHISDVQNSPPGNHRKLLAGAGGEVMGRTKSLDSMAWKTQNHPSQMDARTKRLLSNKPVKSAPAKTKRGEGRGKTVEDQPSAEGIKSVSKKTTLNGSKGPVALSDDEAETASDAEDVSISKGVSLGKGAGKVLQTTAGKTKQAKEGGQKRTTDSKFKSAAIVYDSNDEDDQPLRSTVRINETVAKHTKISQQSAGARSSTGTQKASVEAQKPQVNDYRKPAPKPSVESLKSATAVTGKSGEERSMIQKSTSGKLVSKDVIDINNRAPPKSHEVHETSKISAVKTQKSATLEMSSAASNVTGAQAAAANNLKQTSRKQVPESDRTNALSNATTTSDAVEANGDAPTHHKREPSTASSSWPSNSAKSTPMHRQSSSQSSISVRASEMPKARKRPANSVASKPAPAKKPKVEVAISEVSPQTSSSPLSDAKSISTPVELTSSNHEEPAEVLLNGESPDAAAIATQKYRSTNSTDIALATESAKPQTSSTCTGLESLCNEYRTQFLAFIHLRIDMEKMRPDIPEEMFKRYATVEKEIEETKRAIRKTRIVMAEHEFSSIVPEGLKLDREIGEFLLKILHGLQDEYNKLHDELEGVEDAPSEEIARAARMHRQAGQLMEILSHAEH